MAAKKQFQSEKMNILQNAVLVGLHFKEPGNTGRIDSEKVTGTDAELRSVRVTKMLLDSWEFQAIKSHRATWRNGYLRHVALPVAFGAPGMFVLPLTLLGKVEAAMLKFQQRDTELIERVCAAYEERKEEAKIRLKSEYDESDYPSPETFRASFRSWWWYASMAPSESLKEFDAVLYQRERKKFYEELDETIEKMKVALYSNCADLVEWMVSKLSDTDDGKQKVFGKPFDAKLEKMKEFMDTFKDRGGLIGFTELAPLVDQAKGLLTGISSERVKNNESFRNEMKKKFETVKSKLHGMVEYKASRSIILDE